MTFLFLSLRQPLVQLSPFAACVSEEGHFQVFLTAYNPNNLALEAAGLRAGACFDNIKFAGGPALTDKLFGGTVERARQFAGFVGVSYPTLINKVQFSVLKVNHSDNIFPAPYGKRTFRSSIV